MTDVRDRRARPLEPEEILYALRDRGATALERVALRRNRRTLWSLTRRGRALNLQRAFRYASDGVLADLAVVVMEARLRTDRYRSAARRIAGWPPVLEEVRLLRAESSTRGSGGGPGPCCATEEQKAHLQALYRHLNARRFGGRLPDSVPLRLSSRMETRLGHMAPDRECEGRPAILEIALNADLMLEGNDAACTETLLHEMAHVADFLENGEVGHGPTWRRLAREVGVTPRACRQGAIRRRPRGTPPADRVPPPPPGGFEVATKAPLLVTDLRQAALREPAAPPGPPPRG